jgi:hypothetical protein
MLRVLRSVGEAIGQSHARRLSRCFQRCLGDAARTQARVLSRLLRLNADSDFHRTYGLTGRAGIAEFRRRVPITTYEQLRPYVEQLKQGHQRALCGPQNRLRMFALSSGTTGHTKFIPITDRFLRDYRRGWSIWGIELFDRHPRLRHLRILQLASDFDRFRTPCGLPCGNISGLVQRMQSRFVRFKYVLPPDLLRVADPAAKHALTLRFAVVDRHVGLIATANPGTLVHLARLLAAESHVLIRDIHDGVLRTDLELSGDVRDALQARLGPPNPQRARELSRLADRHGHLRPRDIWPELTAIGVWTAGSAAAYLASVRRSYGNIPIRDHGLSASEGRMTIPFEDAQRDGVLDVTSHFFEFVPEEQGDPSHGCSESLLAHELVPGRNYFILLTTASGLCRYNISDVVRCTGFVGTTPRLEFLHKGAHIANVAGEKVTESQVVEAVNRTSSRFQIHLSYYTVAPVWGDPPGYRMAIEQGELPQGMESGRLADGVDGELRRLNCEYADKRQTGRLAPLAPFMLPPGTWSQFIRQRQMSVGGSPEQYKHPCLKPDLDFCRALLASARDVRAEAG